MRQMIAIIKAMDDFEDIDLNSTISVKLTAKL